ncbi:hypothetical protein F4809DRAFT_621186 [Biscogniauxia mediterranea]|nr:hypothetical protein F4809DRAFT_621186 [Biscogniauxia mediterranea]
MAIVPVQLHTPLSLLSFLFLPLSPVPSPPSPSSFPCLSCPFPLSYERRNECLLLPFASPFAPTTSISWAIRISPSRTRESEINIRAGRACVDEERERERGLEGVKIFEEKEI